MAGALAQHAVEQAVLNVAKKLEDQLDSQLHKLENLKDDDLERIRQKRIDDMRRQQDMAREWAAKGHGQYTEVLEEKLFFKEIKGEERVVAHFYRENWPCKVCGVVLGGGQGMGSNSNSGWGMREPLAKEGKPFANLCSLLELADARQSAANEPILFLKRCYPNRLLTSTWRSSRAAIWRQSSSRCVRCAQVAFAAGCFCMQDSMQDSIQDSMQPSCSQLGSLHAT